MLILKNVLTIAISAWAHCAMPRRRIGILTATEKCTGGRARGGDAMRRELRRTLIPWVGISLAVGLMFPQTANAQDVPCCFIGGDDIGGFCRTDMTELECMAAGGA